MVLQLTHDAPFKKNPEAIEHPHPITLPSTIFFLILQFAKQLPVEGNPSVEPRTQLYPSFTYFCLH